MIDELPDLERLHERHRGLSPAVCSQLAEAARVCMARHGDPPTDWTISGELQGSDAVRRLTWRAVDARARIAHAGERRATEDGACSLAAAAVERGFGWFVLGMALNGTRYDYYVSADLNCTESEANHLEVKGTDHGRIDGRMKEAEQQLSEREESARRPAVICVVAFAQRRIVMKLIPA